MQIFFLLPAISPVNYNLCLQAKMKPLHSYSRRKGCLEFGTVVGIPRFCQFCHGVSWQSRRRLIVIFKNFLDQQEEFSEQNQTFLLLSIPIDKAGSLEERFFDYSPLEKEQFGHWVNKSVFLNFHFCSSILFPNIKIVLLYMYIYIYLH